MKIGDVAYQPPENLLPRWARERLLAVDDDHAEQKREPLNDRHDKPPVKRCWFLHRWNRWKQVDGKVTIGYKGTTQEIVQSFQRRTCQRCGFQEIERL